MKLLSEAISLITDITQERENIVGRNKTTFLVSVLSVIHLKISLL